MCDTPYPMLSVASLCKHGYIVSLDSSARRCFGEGTTGQMWRPPEGATSSSRRTAAGHAVYVVAPVTSASNASMTQTTTVQKLWHADYPTPVDWEQSGTIYPWARQGVLAQTSSETCASRARSLSMGTTTTSRTLGRARQWPSMGWQSGIRRDWHIPMGLRPRRHFKESGTQTGTHSEISHAGAARTVAQPHTPTCSLLVQDLPVGERGQRLLPHAKIRPTTIAPGAF